MKKLFYVFIAVICLSFIGCVTTDNNAKTESTIHSTVNNAISNTENEVLNKEETNDKKTDEDNNTSSKQDNKNDVEETKPEVNSSASSQTEETNPLWAIEEEWLKGYFSDDIVDVNIVCESGTPDAYKIEGSTITFSDITEDSVYSISGKLNGNIVIDVSDEYKFELSLKGLSLVSENNVAIEALGGDEIKISAKKGTSNYIYDYRSKVSEDETSACIYSATDLEIGGKGELVIISKNNNGIHTKDDLQLQNLTLTVYCVDNAVKGNDEVAFEGGKYRLFALEGDAVKTSNDTVSKKGNQKGNIIVNEASIEVYAAKDAFDAAHEEIIDYSTSTITINEAK
ncbi:MAG: carbohydrate-binding domain-containing protein [Lachnospiraceae bacterium]|nr:carbohydrate-binding domain-containing protein [Lachnospiraceae bacterium]